MYQVDSSWSIGLIALLVLLGCSPGESVSVSESQDRVDPIAPLVEADSGPALFDCAKEALPEGVSVRQLENALESGFWNPDRTAIAIAIPQQGDSP